MRPEGRSEKRIRMKVNVRLMGLKEPLSAEKTFTENVSACGARLVSNRPWEPGEKALMTSLMGGYERPARVAYCRPLPDARFLVGLEFRGPWINWVNGLSESIIAEADHATYERKRSNRDLAG